MAHRLDTPRIYWPWYSPQLFSIEAETEGRSLTFVPYFLAVLFSEVGTSSFLSCLSRLLFKICTGAVGQDLVNALNYDHVIIDNFTAKKARQKQIQNIVSASGIYETLKLH